MPSIERRYGNSETMEKKNGNSKRRSKEKTYKEKIWNLTVGVHGMSAISGTKLKNAEKQSRREKNWESDICQKKCE